MTDLTDRMRTCAAFIMSRPHDAPMPTEHLLDDAAELLIEAADILEIPLPAGQQETIAETRAKLGEPMEYMTPWVENPLPSPPQTDLWIAPGGPLPGLKHSGTISPQACPKCDSRAGKRVSRQGKHLMLVCPVCAHVWPYAKKPLAEGPGAAE